MTYTPSDFEIEHGYTPCWLIFKDRHCRYVGPATECAKTFEDCRRHGRIESFTGMPSMDPAVIEIRRQRRVAETVKRWRQEEGLE